MQEDGGEPCTLILSAPAIRCLASLALSRDLEVDQRAGLARGGARDKGAPPEQRGFMGGLGGGGCPHCAQPARPGPGRCRGPPTSLGVGVGSRPGSTRHLLKWLPGCCWGWGRGGGLGDLGPRDGSASLTFTEKPLCAGAILGKRGALVTRQSPHPPRAHCLGDGVREVDTDRVDADLG